MGNGTEETLETPETQETANTAPVPDELAQIKAQLEEERKAAEELMLAAADKDAHIAQLEAQLSEAKSESEAALAETARLKEAEAASTSKYREALLAAHPNIPADLIQGSSIAELHASVEKATATVEAVKKSLETQAAATRVPAGAPTRGGISLEGMSPREKIAYAIKQKGGS
jgi:hypothetical protein